MKQENFFRTYPELLVKGITYNYFSLVEPYIPTNAYLNKFGNQIDKNQINLYHTIHEAIYLQEGNQFYINALKTATNHESEEYIRKIPGVAIDTLNAPVLYREDMMITLGALLNLYVKVKLHLINLSVAIALSSQILSQSRKGVSNDETTSLERITKEVLLNSQVVNAIDTYNKSLSSHGMLPLSLYSMEIAPMISAYQSRSGITGPLEVVMPQIFNYISSNEYGDQYRALFKRLHYDKRFSAVLRNNTKPDQPQMT